MAAITARLLHLRPTPSLNPYTLHHFSSSSSPDPPFNADPQPQPQSEQEPESKPKTPSPFSSYFTDVKASLQREPTVQNRLRRPQPFFNPTPSPQTPTPPSNLASMDEIRRNLSEFRIRSAPPPPPSASSGQTVSLQELYKRNVIPNSNNFTPSPTVTSPNFTALSESIRQMRAGVQTGRNQFAHLKENLNQKSDPNTHLDPTMVVGGAHTDKKESGNEGGGSAAMRNAFYKTYDKPELGMKLKKLRPDKRKGNWFSLQELNERLARLREVEEKEETQKGIGGIDFRHLRHSLEKLKATQDENKNQKIKQKLNVLSHLGGTPSFMLSPPKEHLVEQYFHPDNMSSAEKLKLELKKVREEFKMSETDCGSARVQVAQLTTKIKHLSTVLAKKDKHSRKGLLAMVQRRKKLLKYLRRTDFDSYSLVLSKLGLRDNPDIKA